MGTGSTNELSEHEGRTADSRTEGGRTEGVVWSGLHDGDSDVTADVDVASEDESASADGDAERRQLRIGAIAIVVVAAVLGASILVAELPDPVPAKRSSGIVDTARSPISVPPLVLSRIRPRDTVFTTDSVYLDVNLTRQHVTVRFRSGREQAFRISSGNPYIRDGMATPVGLFTVQNMQPMAISRQFNDARLHHWIGVQGGVGFHGLDGSGYYWNLGVRPSSHGCIRMARNEIAQMYKLVHPGSLIMVHYGTPARVVGFCDAHDTVGARLIDSASVFDRSLGRDNMQRIMSGRYWVESRPRLVHLANQRVRWGLEIGDARRIPRQQVPPLKYVVDASSAFAHPVRPDQSHVDRIGTGIASQLKKYADSTLEARRNEMKADERNVQYGN